MVRLIFNIWSYPILRKSLSFRNYRIEMDGGNNSGRGAVLFGWLAAIGICRTQTSIGFYDPANHFFLNYHVLNSTLLYHMVMAYNI